MFTDPSKSPRLILSDEFSEGRHGTALLSVIGRRRIVPDQSLAAVVALSEGECWQRQEVELAVVWIR